MQTGLNINPHQRIDESKKDLGESTSKSRKTYVAGHNKATFILQQQGPGVLQRMVTPNCWNLGTGHKALLLSPCMAGTPTGSYQFFRKRPSIKPHSQSQSNSEKPATLVPEGLSNKRKMYLFNEIWEFGNLIVVLEDQKRP